MITSTQTGRQETEKTKSAIRVRISVHKSVISIVEDRCQTAGFPIQKSESLLSEEQSYASFSRFVDFDLCWFSTAKD